MKVVLALAVASFIAGTQPAPKPNFSGDWSMNPAKSNFGILPAPTQITRKITHAEPALTIVELQRSALGDQNATRTYVTDGSESVFNADGAEIKSSASWKEGVLVVVSTVGVLGLTYHDSMTLSDDGKTLTSLVHIVSAQGAVDATVVFDRQ